MSADVLSWVVFGLVALVSGFAIVRAHRSGTRSAATPVVRLGCGAAAIGFVLTLAMLVGAFELVGRESDPARKTAVLSQGIADAMPWSRRLIPLGLVVAFMGGVLRGLAPKAVAEPQQVDPKTFE